MMGNGINTRVRGHRRARLLARVGAVLGCTVALGAGYAAAAGVGLGPITVFTTSLPGGYRPEALAAGSDGALWYSAVRTQSDSAIGRISTDGATSSFGAGLSPGARPGGMAAGPDGNVWFTNGLPGRAFARISPDGTITELPTPAGVGGSSVAAGPDGNIWFAGGKTIGKITPGGQITTYGSGLGQSSSVLDIAAGSDGALWFADAGRPAIGRITPDGTITEYTAGLGASSRPTEIAAGPGGNLWFLDGSAVGRITPGGQITEFALPANTGGYAIAAGPDGNMWFVEPGLGLLGRVAPDGTVTEFDTSSYGLVYPFSIATGPDGDIWFGGVLPTTFVAALARMDVGAPAASVAPPEVTGPALQGSAEACGGARWADWAGTQPSTTAFAFDGYQWLRDGNPIQGGTAQTYTPTAGDAGHQLSCRVTATYTLFPATVSATSAGVSITALPGTTTSGGGSSGGAAGASGGNGSGATGAPATTPAPAPPRTPASGAAKKAPATVSVLTLATVHLDTKPPKLHVTLKASDACSAVLTLLGPNGKPVASWKLHLRRGTTKVALVLPAKARHHGRDTLRVQTGTTKAKTLRVTVR